MSGRIYKFTRNFHVPYGAHKPVSRDSFRRSRMMEHTSRLKAKCADFMGSLSCKCRIILKCSVKVRWQAWHAFQIEGRGGRVQSQGRCGWVVSSKTVVEVQIIRENFQHNYGIIFSRPEEKMGSYNEKPQRCRTVQTMPFIKYMYNSRRRHQAEK